VFVCIVVQYTYLLSVPFPSVFWDYCTVCDKHGRNMQC